jgi:TRAP transporter TAXI family solute receptor
VKEPSRPASGERSPGALSPPDDARPPPSRPTPSGTTPSRPTPSRPTPSRPTPSRTLAVLGIAAVASVVLLVALAWLVEHRSIDRVRLATGTPGGTFLPLGQTLAAGWGDDLDGVALEALPSAGGIASVQMLERGEAELALLSNHVAGSGRLRLIAPLYQETLQIVVRTDAAIETAFDLRGRRVSVGPEGSGTESIADAILAHFGVGRDGVVRTHATMTDAASGLERGELDAAFLVAGMRTPAVDRLLARDDMRLLSLGDPSQIGSALEGIRLDAPFFAVTAIPERAYGRHPDRPIGTISVWALLVVRDDLPDELVHALTRSMFDHKVELASHSQLLAHLGERFDPAVSPYPIHPGADEYYRRAEPSFVRTYTDQIGLLVTLAVLLWSGLTALAASRRRGQKDRIELRYGAAHALAAKARAARASDELRDLHGKLIDMREQALEDLATERVQANEAFVILQDYLTAQIAELERRIDPLEAREPPRA